MSKQIPHLVVAQAAVREALHTLSTGARDEDGDEVRISYRESEMILALADGSVSIAAEGWWPGEARCPLAWLLALPGAGAALRMEHRAARLHVGDRSVQSPWRDATLPPVSVPRDTSLPYLPQLRNEGADDAPPGGEETDRLASATRILAPLGITHRDLERLVAANKARESGELDLR